MSEAWTAGASVLHYRLESELGEGGMGQVWAAVDTRLGRRVALKAIPPELAFDPSRLERLRREARTLATLNHPNIVTIFAIEETEDRQFLVMELVDGATLGQAIPRHGLPLEEFFDIATALAEALATAHEQGITHRDLKPENVMVSAGGRVKVLDFGLAKPTASGPLDPSRVAAPEHSRPRGGVPSTALDILRSPASGATLTREGEVVGTLPYMSPEQIEGRPLDHRSDIFSLGTVLYEMVTGRRPFTGKSPTALISSILRDVPSSVTELRIELPRHLGRIIRQCMEKRPEDRFQSARDVFNQLRDLRDELAPRRGSDSSAAARPRSHPRPASSSGVSPARAAMASRTGPTLLLATIFVVNWLETAAEAQLAKASDLMPRLGLEIAAAMHRLEGLISFQGHDNTNPVAIYGYSIAYFFVLPVLAIALAIALARRPALSAYRVLALAVTVVYAVSLPFYLLFPVPERWAYPDSEAILLSDLWTTRLIETIRPISGIDNCFPSVHTSLTAVLVAVAFRYRIRLRWCVTALGITVVLATFVLGIHWIPDIAAGIATGILGFALALRFERRLDGRAFG